VAGRIKGITVEIGGDTTGLQKALKGVNSAIKNTQSQLKDVEKLLKLDPGNTELLAQKQKLLKDAIGETKEKLETLKTAAEQANTALANEVSGINTWVAIDNLSVVGTSAAEVKTTYKVYTVAKGDTLWGISQKYLGSGARYTEITVLAVQPSMELLPEQISMTVVLGIPLI